MSQSAAQKLERIKEQKALTPEQVSALRPSFWERVREWAKSTFTTEDNPSTELLWEDRVWHRVRSKRC